MRPVCCSSGLTSSMKAGVEKISAGSRPISVFSITILAKELFSISVRKFSPARRPR
ncbi:hypothetical protein D3C72_2298110 [compost metagenome]